MSPSAFHFFALMLFLCFAELSFAQPKTDESPNALLGSWTQSCFASRTKKEDFAKATVTYTETYFREKDCQTPLFEISNSGAYRTNENKVDFTIDFTFAKNEIKLLNKDIVQNYIQAKVCGFSDWEINKTKNIDDQACDFFLINQPIQSPPKGTQRFGIYHLDYDLINNQALLYFGKLTPQFDGTTPEKRPKILDSIPYKKTTTQNP